MSNKKVHAIQTSFFTIDQQNADDIGWALTGIHILENIEKEIHDILKGRNLFINKARPKNTQSQDLVKIIGKNVNTLKAF